MSNKSEKEIKIGDATYSFGGPCPPIKSIFFPNDPNQKPYEIEEVQQKEREIKNNDSSQSS